VIKSGVRTRTSAVLVQIGARRDNQHPAAGWSLSTAANRALSGGVWFHVVPDAVGSDPGWPASRMRVRTSLPCWPPISYMYISNKVPCNLEIPSSQSAAPCRLHRRIHGSITTTKALLRAIIISPWRATHTRPRSACICTGDANGQWTLCMRGRRPLLVMDSPVRRLCSCRIRVGCRHHGGEVTL
jgi:hypothetical protein